MATVAEALTRGWQLQQAGELKQAENVYRQVLHVAPNEANAWCYLGMVLFDQRRFHDSVAAYEKAIRLNPKFPIALNNLGNALKALRRFSEAKSALERALRLDHNYANAYANLGGVFLAMEQPDHAVEACRRALKIAPENIEARNSLAGALVRQGRPAEAIECCRRVLQQMPRHAGAYNNWGAALARQCKFMEAANVFRQLLEFQPDNAESWKGLAVCLSRAGEDSEAIECFEKSIAIAPGVAEAHRDFGITLLRSGRFAEGWPEYEWRWKCEGRRMPVHSRPLWDGGSLGGRTIFLYNEQGLGDTLQFVRFASLLKRTGATVIVQCQKPLLPLIRLCPDIDAVIAEGQSSPPFDCHAPLMSLPRLLGISPTTIPANIPYLSADDGLTKKWRAFLPDDETFKVGISWQGNPRNEIDYFRSAPLRHFAPIWSHANVRVYSLQKNVGTEQLADLENRDAIEHLGDRLDEGSGAFMDTAAVMKNLDLFISSDTATVHLAGGLGVNTWVALSHTADWRWLADREDCPWYPTMRLFRQTEIGDWSGVFHRIGLALEDQLRRANQ